jgi:urea transporter
VTAAQIAVHFGRQVLRGFSQCAFQSNEVTGLLFIAAVAVFDWRMTIFYVVSGVVGTLAAKALRGADVLLDLGLFGFNSALMGLALAAFFQASPAAWVCMPILAMVTAAVTVAMSKWVPFPFIAAPFIVTFWAIWPLATTLGLTAVDFGAFPQAPVTWVTAVIAALGSALFVPSIIAGLLFLAGVLIANWRHAIVAVIGAAIAAALAAQAGAPGAAVNSGFVGFNAVLAALAAYNLIAADLRLVALASVLSTWVASYVYRGAPVPVLASGFVLSIWLMLFLGWLNPRFAGDEPQREAD